MKSRHALLLVLFAALIFSAAGCGKKDEAPAPAAEATPAATPIDMATVGSVAGSVKLDGPAPRARPINMAAEPSCAALHTTPQLDETVVVGGHAEMEVKSLRANGHVQECIGFHNLRTEHSPLCHILTS